MRTGIYANAYFYSLFIFPMRFYKFSMRNNAFTCLICSSILLSNDTAISFEKESSHIRIENNVEIWIVVQACTKARK